MSDSIEPLELTNDAANTASTLEYWTRAWDTDGREWGMAVFYDSHTQAMCDRCFKLASAGYMIVSDGNSYLGFVCMEHVRINGHKPPWQ